MMITMLTNKHKIIFTVYKLFRTRLMQQACVSNSHVTPNVQNDVNWCSYGSFALNVYFTVMNVGIFSNPILKLLKKCITN